ncbi:MAG: UvrD-helicase domain-containing protein [Deltaproteobacteria bacterium]|nr:UvrD-helicase domain-containing protein [Deltaproteobacteria bacterium]
MKPTFQTEWLALPPKVSHQVLEKISLLAQDPRPDGFTKKKLKHLDGKLHRIRCGDYRIFYTYEDPYVSLLALRKRDERTYDDGIDSEFLGGFDPAIAGSARSRGADWEALLKPTTQSSTPLPEEITPELLNRLRIPEALHARLTRLESREALFECPGVPEEVILKVDEVLFERPLEEVIEQPDYVANDVCDLLRFKEGSLLGFLLKLDPEQKKFVTWALDAKGPTLVKGGPGTGKSTVALYRVRSLLEAIGRTRPPRVLFTTYTNALVAYSHQLLEQLLGADVDRVDVRTADSVVHAVVRRHLGEFRMMRQEEDQAFFRDAVEKTDFGGGSLAQRSERSALERLGLDYIWEEVGEVIEGRGLAFLDDYLQAPRAGRRVALNANQRRAVWKVRETYNRLLERSGDWTWQRLRLHAARLVREGKGLTPYDAVVVDEAQDLDPITLGMLSSLCREPNRLFITADANQSIYRSGFRWSDVHESLQFRGRTGILRTNHRSTAEIGEATAGYLGGGNVEAGSGEERRYSHSGPLPAVRTVGTEDAEAALLARFFPAASRELRLGISACAALVPTQTAGQALARRLSEKGLPVEFMTGKTLELEKPVVKVLTFKSAKGLEFPVVALGGFVLSRYPRIPGDFAEEATAEWLARERRSLFVAMTRAMHALLVVLPEGRAEPLFEGFDRKLWNLA